MVCQPNSTRHFIQKQKRIEKVENFLRWWDGALCTRNHLDVDVECIVLYIFCNVT